MKAFVAFLSDERDALVTPSVETALKICEKLEIPIEERRIRDETNARRTKSRRWFICS